jgi:hypothetical protein
MGRGIILSDRQWDELDQLRFTTSSADVFRNCLIVLKSDSAETIPSIAEQLGCAPETVKRVRRLYRQGGIDALRPGHSPGRPSKATSLSPSLAPGRDDRSAHARLRLFHLVGRTLGRASGSANQHPLQSRPTAPTLAPRGLLRTAAQAHHEGPTRRGCLHQGQEAAPPAKKRP